MISNLSSSNGLPSYEPYDITDEGPKRTSSVVQKKTIERSISVQPSTVQKKPLQAQISSPPVGLSSRFKISTVDETNLQEKGSFTDYSLKQPKILESLTQNNDVFQGENKEESPNTSAESDDVFIVEKVVEDNSEAQKLTIRVRPISPVTIHYFKHSIQFSNTDNRK